MVLRVPVNDAPPYRVVQTQAEGGPRFSGIYVDILFALAAETGLTVQFIEVPFARGFAMMQGGDADMLLGPNRTPEREQFMYYLEAPLPAESKALMVREDGPRIASYDDLKGLRIAVLRAAQYFDRFDQDASLHKILAQDYAEALRLLGGRRADAVIVPEMQGRWLMRQAKQGYRLAEFKAPGSPSYFALARKSPLMARADEIQAALKRLLDRGDFLRLLLLLYG
jgi:polar amino acid transport system substrate-binding protein